MAVEYLDDNCVPACKSRGNFPHHHQDWEAAARGFSVFFIEKNSSFERRLLDVCLWMYTGMLLFIVFPLPNNHNILRWNQYQIWKASGISTV